MKLMTPFQLKALLPISSRIAQFVEKMRQEIIEIVSGNDSRLLVIVGPCSIHDPVAALEYATRLKIMADQCKTQLCLVMRVYLDKPRTTLGWRGLINDPFLDNSYQVNDGLQLARKLLLDINELGMGVAMECLDTFIPAYLMDLIAWVAIGARTSESQIHRELASSLPTAVGFKNNTHGNIQVALDAIHVAKYSHRYMGLSEEGMAAVIHTQGNEHGHLILRGSNTETNYSPWHVKSAADLLKTHGLPSRLMIDCSHGNAQKEYQSQKKVVQSICEQMEHREKTIFGVMLESHLIGGRQSLSSSPLRYGQSITDGCLSWEETVVVLEKLALR